MSIVVFYLNQGGPCAREFKDTELKEALAYAENLRKLRREQNYRISHVCIQSEMSEKVGDDGVTDVGTGYEWKKDFSISRRRKESRDDNLSADPE